MAHPAAVLAGGDVQAQMAFSMPQGAVGLGHRERREALGGARSRLASGPATTPSSTACSSSLTIGLGCFMAGNVKKCGANVQSPFPCPCPIASFISHKSALPMQLKKISVGAGTKGEWREFKRRITFALLSGQVDSAKNARLSW